MAIMKYGRTTLAPKYIDPKTGNRIADPNVYGKTVDLSPSGDRKGTYISWPDFRQKYQSGAYKDIELDRKGRGVLQQFPADVNRYLSGKTDKLSEEYDEPLEMTEMTTSGESAPSYELNYKPGSKTYKTKLYKYNAEMASAPKEVRQSYINQSPKNSEPAFSIVAGDVRWGRQDPRKIPNPESMSVEEVATTQATAPTPTEPTKPKKTKVTEKVVEGVEGWDFKEPKYKSKTIRVKDKTPGIKESGGIKKSSRTVKTTSLVPIGKHNTRERRLWETYEVGSYKGKDFRGMTEEQLRGLTKQARQDKRGAMFEGDFSYSKSAIKKIKEARKYAGRENVAGLSSAQEKVNPMRVYESKVWTGEYKDESGKILPGKFMKNDEYGNLSPLNKVVTNSKGEKIITERENTENKIYDSGFFALKKGGPSKNKLYTIDMQQGYAGSKQYGEAKSSFKSSMNNATNRNSLQAKIVTSLNRQKLERQNRRKSSGN
jgi:hypothetical protein